MSTDKFDTRIFIGTTGDTLKVLTASDGEIGIMTKGASRDDEDGYRATYLRPQEALELAADLILRVHKILSTDDNPTP